MANENDIAILTDRIAQTMTRARIVLTSAADSLSEQNFGQVLDARMADIRAMSDLGGKVQDAEFDAEAQRRFAARTGDPRDAADLRDARNDVQRQFGYAQEEGRDFARRIGAAQEQLTEIRDDLGRSGAALDQALRDVDTLATFPEFADKVDSMRTRVTSMRTHTAVAYRGLQAADGQLENAKAAALQFGRLEREVDRYSHSSEVTRTSTELTGDVTQTRDSLTSVRTDIVAHTQQIEDLDRDAFKDAELADAVRAGMNPTPAGAQAGERAGSESGSGIQDLHARLAQQTSDSSRER